MTGLVVALPPASNFPAGSLTYAFYAAAVLKAPIYAPGGIASEFCPEHIRVNYCKDLSDNIKYDFSLVTPVSNELMEYIDRLPRPIIVVVHDGHTLYEFGGKDWVNKVDGFLVDVDPTISCILKMANNASVLRIQLPYVRRPFSQYSEFPIWDNKKNIIVSLGRIVPDRGHRLVATLCSMGYNVLVVGQEVRHDEYGLYYKKILDAGANIIPTPSDSEKFEILGSAKIAMGFSFTQEVDEPVEYSNCECINMGCYPIVANWQKRYFDDAGFSFNSIESPAAAPQYIDRMFSDNEYYIGCCKYNISVLDNYSRQFGVRFEKFVSELKNRVNCSNCGAIIPVRSMYCAICGKK